MISCVASPPLRVAILGTSAADGTTLLTLPGYERTRVLDALGVTEEGPLRGEGHIHQVSVTVAPNTSGRVEVDVHEPHKEIGASWQAGVGMASFVAARILDSDLLDFTFTAESSQPVDGPSSSGLMTAGFLAALTSADIDPDATMTGTINPDGTIGPVSGIPEKFAAAIDRGKHKLGFPIGMRHAKSLVTGQPVDLVELATSHGAQAFEIGDVRQAYHLLTHRDLPAVVPVDDDDMRLDQATSERLLAQMDERQKAMAQRWQLVLQLEADPQTPGPIRQLARDATAALGRSQVRRAKGRAAAAHLSMIVAWRYALAASALQAVVDKAATGDAAGAIAIVEALIPLAGTDQEVLAAIAAVPTKTIADQLRMMQADRSALQGWNEAVWLAPRLAKARQALASLVASHASSAAVIAAVEPVIGALCMRAQLEALAKDRIAIAGDPKGTTAAPAPAIERTATSLRAAAAAAIAYFDALAVASFANHANRTDIKAEIAERDPNFLFAHVAYRLDREALPAQLARAWGTTAPSWLLLELAGAELGFTQSSTLLSQYYSLGISGDTVAHPEAFAAMLEMAQRTAREAARAARIAIGAIPVPAKIEYELAELHREGSTRDRVAALEAYWTSSMYSQTAVMLARHR